MAEPDPKNEIPPQDRDVDRTAVRRLLQLTPAERIRLAVREANELEALP